MTITNGANHNTVEDLLSSIRNHMNEDHGSVRAGPSSPLNGPHNGMAGRHSGLSEEHAEFELPAIFKPGHHQNHSDKPNNLFGRLSDALKPAPAAEPERSRTVIRFEPAGGRMIEPPAQPMTAQAARSEPPVDPADKVVAENAPVRREMPSFFDARLNRMGEMTRQVNTPKPVEPPKPAPQAIAPQPPPLRPQPPAADTSAGGLEDAAAQLLRPILKQWLTENMPKIVEKALRSEAADDFSQSAPPSGMGTNGRKPGQ